MRLYGCKKGALEGLPLYLIILVVVAAVATAAILGWMKTIQKAELGSIKVTDVNGKTIDTIKSGTTKTIRVYAYDTNGKPLSGAVVKIVGPNVDEMGKTGSSGYMQRKIKPVLPENERHGQIEITVSYTGKVYNELHYTIVVNG